MPNRSTSEMDESLGRALAFDRSRENEDLGFVRCNYTHKEEYCEDPSCVRWALPAVTIALGMYQEKIGQKELDSRAQNILLCTGRKNAELPHFPDTNLGDDNAPSDTYGTEGPA